MIRFWFHDYTLVPEQSLNAVAGAKARAGTLLKMQWPDGKVGYSDLSTWPELGEQEVAVHLQEFRQGRISPLIEQSLWLARRDAVLRAAGKNAFTDLPKLKNHFLVSDYTTCTDSMLAKAASDGFTTLKMKMGRDLGDESQWLVRKMQTYGFNVRLDFNSKATFTDIERLAAALPVELKRKIDYVEDPFAYDNSAWAETSKLLPLALDFEYDKVDWDHLPATLPFTHIILKPVRQEVAKIVRRARAGNLKICVTSNMDHPVGVAHALYVAGELKKELNNQVVDCGLLTNRLYAMNEFATQMVVQGPSFTEVVGTGIGFDSLLENLTWIELKGVQ